MTGVIIEGTTKFIHMHKEVAEPPPEKNETFIEKIY